MTAAQSGGQAEQPWLEDRKGSAGHADGGAGVRRRMPVHDFGVLRPLGSARTDADGLRCAVNLALLMLVLALVSGVVSVLNAHGHGEHPGQVAVVSSTRFMRTTCCTCPSGSSRSAWSATCRCANPTTRPVAAFVVIAQPVPYVERDPVGAVSSHHAGLQRSPHRRGHPVRTLSALPARYMSKKRVNYTRPARTRRASCIPRP